MQARHKERPDPFLSRDNEGKILDRADEGNIAGTVGQTWGYENNPEVGETYHDDSGSHTRQPAIEFLRYRVFGGKGGWFWYNGYDSATASYHSYAYADGNPVADVKREGTLRLKTVALNMTQASPVTTKVNKEVLGKWVTLDVTMGKVTVGQNDLRYDEDGTLDRHATARALAERLYGLNNLASPAAREGLVTALEGKLPQTLAAGATFLTDRYQVVLDRTFGKTTVVTDYAYQGIGGEDGLGGGGAQRHTVTEGQTLRAIAANYYGSSSYWYLIADANGLSADDELKTGTQLTIPNVLTNSLNDKDTYKVYNKSEIIGSDDPVVRVKQKSQPGGFFASIVKILIVVIIVVVAVYVAQVASSLYSMASGALSSATATTAAATTATTIGSALGVGTVFTGAAAYAVAAVGAAAFGYAAMYAASYVTQGLAIAAELQEEFDWKAMDEMGSSGAVGAIAAFAGAWVDTSKFTAGQEALARGGIEVGSQALQNDGRVENLSGVVKAMLPAGAEWADSDAMRAVANNKMAMEGLSMLENSIDHGISALDWAGFATAALGDSSANNPSALNGRSMQFDWNTFGRNLFLQGAIGLAVNGEMGEDAAYNNIGESVGGLLGASWNEQFKFEQDLAALPDGLADSIFGMEGLSDADKIKAVGQYGKHVRSLSGEERQAFVQAFEVGAPAPAADATSDAAALARSRAAIANALNDPNRVVIDDQGRVVSGNRPLTPEEQAGYTLQKASMQGAVAPTDGERLALEGARTFAGGELRGLLSEDEAKDATTRFDALARHGANLMALSDQIVEDDAMFNMIVADLQDNGQGSEFAALLAGGGIPTASEFAENRQQFANGVRERGLFASQLSQRGLRDLGYDAQVAGQFSETVNGLSMDVIRAIGTGSTDHLGIIDVFQGDTMKLAQSMRAAGLVSDSSGYGLFKSATDDVLMGTLRELVPTIDAAQGAMEAMSAGAAIMSLRDMANPDIHNKAVREGLEKAITAAVKGEAYAAGVLGKKLTKIPALRKYAEKLGVGASAEAVTSFVLDASGLFTDVTGVPLQGPVNGTPTVRNNSNWGVDILAKTQNGEWVPFEVKGSERGKAPALSSGKGGQRQGADDYVSQQLDRAIRGSYGSWKSVEPEVSQTARWIREEMVAGGFERFRGYVVKIDNMVQPRNTKTSIYEWKKGAR